MSNYHDLPPSYDASTGPNSKSTAEKNPLGQTQPIQPQGTN